MTGPDRQGQDDADEAFIADVPLFPLQTVLFPGGVLPLRVFEARYLDLVRECMKDEREFGVCRIVNGTETGPAADHEEIGCLARITHWDMPQLGLLQIRTVGTRRFAIQARRVGSNALIRADVALLSIDPPTPMPLAFAGCAELLRQMLADLDRRVGPSPLPVLRPYQLDSASWVANRLAEILPIDPAERQLLLGIDDPLVRLAGVQRHLEARRILPI